MKKAAVSAAVLVVLALAAGAVLVARFQQNAEPKPQPSSQPAWITEAVTSMRRMFVGNPEPKSVRYHEGRKTADVTIRFSESAVCSYCGGPEGAPVPRGRVATTSLEVRTHRTLGFSLRD